MSSHVLKLRFVAMTRVPTAILLVWFLITSVMQSLVRADVTAEQIRFFESRIRPLLVARCYKCHSGEAKAIKGGLRLDSRSAMLKGGDSGAAIVPSAPDKSLLMQAVHYQSYEMPPDGKLSDAQIALLAKWIDLGAPWPATQKTGPDRRIREVDWQRLRSEHWAWRPIQKPALPVVKASHPLSPIDHFVLGRLERTGLQHAAPAEPRTLIRRISLDLIGLPPAPAAVDRFVAAAARDPQAAASRLVDELLASQQYGERWARHWLDVARYSDGYGGFLDNAALTQAWRYRDWVVDALNRDLPYDQFPHPSDCRRFDGSEQTR